MANILRFVDTNLTTVRLTLEYIEDGTSIPMPANTKVWSGNITADGQDYITGKYENIPIILKLKVSAASKAALDTALRALITEITRENILEFQPEGGSSIFYDTFPYDAAEAQTVMAKAYRDAFMVYPFTVTLMAKPVARVAEATITIVDNLVPNWQFETVGGGGQPLDGWTKHEHGAGDSVTQDTDAGDFLFGVAALNLTSTTTGNHARETTTDFITIDKTKHYCIVFNYNQESGTLVHLTCGIEHYDNAGVIGTTTIFTPTVTALDNWYSYTAIIHPNGGGGNEWDADAAKCKIYFDCTGVTGGDAETYYIDGVVFTCSEYLSGNTLSNPLGIVLPGKDAVVPFVNCLLGDVPSPADIYLSALDTTVDNKAAIYVGGREEYDANFVPSMLSTTGTAAAGNIANQGDYRTIAIPGNLILNPSFETLTSGTPGANDENWANWVEVRGAATCYLLQDANNPYRGTYRVKTYVNEPAPKVNSMTSDYTAVNAANLHQFSLAYMLVNNSMNAILDVNIECYSAVPALTGTLHPLWTNTTTSGGWNVLNYNINAIGGAAPAFPAATTQVKIKISFTGGWWDAGLLDYGYWDMATLISSSVSVSFDGKDLVDRVEGFVKPFLHYKLDAAETDMLQTFQGNMEDVALGDITALAQLQTKSCYYPATWIYGLDFAAEYLPSHRLSDDAATTAIYQELQVLFDPTLDAATLASIDDLSLIPVDNGYATVSTIEKQYLIFDSNSEMPMVLTSLDGTKSKAVILESATLRQGFTVDPQNGSNYAILSIWADSSGNQYGQFLDEVTLKYQPRYLLVK